MDWDHESLPAAVLPRGKVDAIDTGFEDVSHRRCPQTLAVLDGRAKVQVGCRIVRCGGCAVQAANIRRIAHELGDIAQG